MWSAIKSTKICPSHLAINGTIPFHPCVLIRDGNPFRLQMQPTLRLVYLSLTRNPRTWMRELWSRSSSAISWLVSKDSTRSAIGTMISCQIAWWLIYYHGLQKQCSLGCWTPLLLTEQLDFSSNLWTHLQLSAAHVPPEAESILPQSTHTAHRLLLYCWYAWR